jgi:uncharacterized protein (TIGR02677 family)
VSRVPLQLRRGLVAAVAAQASPPPVAAASAEAPHVLDGPPASVDPPVQGPALRPQPVLKYAVVEEAARYRRLMRVLYTEHRNFGLRLRPEQVSERAREGFGLVLEPEQVQAALDQLEGWGALDREHDASLASTPREYRRNRFTYDITPAGRRAEELLAELDELHHQIGALDGTRLPAITGALNLLADLLAQEAPDPAEVRSRFEQVLGEVGRLHSGAIDFMRSLNAVIARGEQVDDGEFERCKGALIDHLQGFRRDRQRHADEIVRALERVERQRPERMAELIVGAQEIPELPGVSPAEVAARRRDELLGQWAGVRAWFLGGQRSGSPWQTLNEKIVAAIRAILDIAEAIVERRSGRADRAQALEHLAQLAARARPGQAVAVLAAAAGVALPRHVGTPELDPEALGAAPGRTSWWDAPAAPVVAFLRRPGARTPGAGRGAAIADTAGARARAADRRRRERAELDRLLRRFEPGAQVWLGDLGRLDAGEFRHLLHWIGRAFETPRDAAGDRRAWSADGRVEIRLRPPSVAGRRVRLQVPQGSFECPDYELQVRPR